MEFTKVEECFEMTRWESDCGHYMVYREKRWRGLAGARGSRVITTISLYYREINSAPFKPIAANDDYFKRFGGKDFLGYVPTVPRAQKFAREHASEIAYRINPCIPNKPAERLPRN